jgi:hypothetical protein
MFYVYEHNGRYRLKKTDQKKYGMGNVEDNELSAVKREKSVISKSGMHVICSDKLCFKECEDDWAWIPNHLFIYYSFMKHQTLCPDSIALLRAYCGFPEVDRLSSRFFEDVPVVVLSKSWFSNLWWTLLQCLQ